MLNLKILLSKREYNTLQHTLIHQKIQEPSHLACQLLTARGCHGQMLRVKLKTVDVPRSNTVPNSKARQEAIATAKYQRTRFLATRGGHLFTDDIFEAMELKTRTQETELVETDKTLCLADEKVEKQALKILEGAGNAKEEGRR